MNVPAENSPKSELRIYFPARKREYDYFSELAVDPKLRTEVLRAQRDHQHQSGDPARYARCMCGCDPLALYAIRACRLPDDSTQYRLARFPNSGHHHAATCEDFKDDFQSSPDDDRPEPELGPGDFSVLINGAKDSAHRRHKDTSSVRNPDSPAARRKRSMSAASLRMLGRILLEDADICMCQPGFARTRGFREVNGLAYGALKKLRSNPQNRYGKLLEEIPSHVTMGPWSLATSTSVSAAGTAPVALGFGFVIAITDLTPAGDRELILQNAPAKKLLVRSNLIAEAIKVSNFPTNNDQLRFPVWAIFVAAFFPGQWTAIKLAFFRMTKLGLLPVESAPEEKMVEYLIRERRTFRRCLLPPEEGCKYVPDFILTDTVPQYFLEVAGRTEDEYLRQLERKRQHWKDQVIVWHSRDPLPHLPPPKRDLLLKEIPSGEPQLPVEAERPQAACT